jgi:hypothetical protein
MNTLSSATNIFLQYASKILLFFTVTSYLGLGFTKPAGLTILDYYLKIFLALYLLYRFNPYYGEIKFQELDRRVAFSAGVFLFTTTVLNGLLMNYSNKYRDEIQKQIHLVEKKLSEH